MATSPTTTVRFKTVYVRFKTDRAAHDCLDACLRSAFYKPVCSAEALRARERVQRGIVTRI